MHTQMSSRVESRERQEYVCTPLRPSQDKEGVALGQGCGPAGSHLGEMSRGGQDLFRSGFSPGVMKRKNEAYVPYSENQEWLLTRKRGYGPHEWKEAEGLGGASVSDMGDVCLHSVREDEGCADQGIVGAMEAEH